MSTRTFIGVNTPDGRNGLHISKVNGDDMWMEISITDPRGNRMSVVLDTRENAKLWRFFTDHGEGKPVFPDDPGYAEET
jgi:hypothetical protein